MVSSSDALGLICLLQSVVYSMAQASKAVLPRDVGGPWGKRIGVTVGGELNWALRVGAYVTGRVSSTDWLRYSLVVLNCEGRSVNLRYKLNA
jgi:hypothetical protein